MSTKSKSIANLNSGLNWAITPKKIFKLLQFAFVFGGLKLNAISAALLLSNFFSPSLDFGIFDLALTCGVLLAILFNAGLQAAIPYYLLKEKNKTFLPTFYFHGLVLLTFFTLIASALYVLGIELHPAFSLAISIALIISLQALSSVINKAKENIYRSVFLDASFFVCINGYNLYLYYTGQLAALSIIQHLLLLLLGFYFGFYCFHFWNTRKSFQLTKYFQALRFGIPLIGASLLILGLTSSGRIIVAQVLGIEQVGLYGIYFRIAGIVVLVHQVINIAFFKKLYQGDRNQLDNWFSRFLVLIILLSIASYGFIPKLMLPYLKIVADTWTDYQSLFIAFQFQMFFWITLALFENVIHREKQVKAFNKGLLLILIALILLIAIGYFSAFLNLTTLVALNTLAIYAGVEWQINLLKKIQLPFTKTCQVFRFAAVLQVLLLIL